VCVCGAEITPVELFGLINAKGLIAFVRLYNIFALMISSGAFIEDSLGCDGGKLERQHDMFLLYNVYTATSRK
jgi:hypothetical protein